VLRTHSPLRARIATNSSFDLPVLSTPPAFILSQDQTLRKNCFTDHRNDLKRSLLRFPCGKSLKQILVSFYHSSVVKVLAFLLPRALLPAQEFYNTICCFVCQDPISTEKPLRSFASVTSRPAIYSIVVSGGQALQLYQSAGLGRDCRSLGFYNTTPFEACQGRI
jgi:hypothetical protein